MWQFLCWIGLGVIVVAPLGAQTKRRFRACVTREETTGESATATPTLPVMFTAVTGGQVVRQSEGAFPAHIYSACGVLTDLAPGSYDVRVEASGMRTEVKRGVRLFDDQDGELKFVMNPGRGLRTVEYAEGALAREEVAARLAALEGTVAKLQAERAATAASDKPGPRSSKP